MTRAIAATPEKALAICKPCRVKKECRDYALEAGERFGMWGGMGPKGLAAERKRLGIQIASN
jgi:WhiB family redox-sensing transcriptional regulator